MKIQNIKPAKTKKLLKQILFSAAVFLFSLKSFAANYYWVGGTGNWSNYANHWATTSGGVIFHTTIPSFNDDVFFDANSFASASTVTADSTFIYCHNMDWTGAQFNPSFEGPNPAQLKIYGSLTLVQGMQFTINEVHFLAAAGTQTIASLGGGL
ncbi:MAG TPA: hypothetical protein VJY62_06815, partial [Bacteroidia bacterium]|nr:hypothetical protein [Bacteroidia bacterium]